MLSEGGAPNFKGTTFPGDGERLGVAWRAIWAFLADGQVHSLTELQYVGMNAVEAMGRSIRGKTVYTLLYEGWREGVLAKEKRKDKITNRDKVYFKREK